MLVVIYGLIVQATAATGVAASLYRFAITLHAFGGIPVPFPEEDDVASSISMEDPRAQLIIKANFLVVDEALSLDSKILDLLDRTCQKFRKNESPFGGLVVLFCGDPRQTLAVIRNADAQTQMNRVISSCKFYPVVVRLELDENLRVRNSPDTAEFSQMVLNFGNGTVPHISEADRVDGAPKDSVQIPEQYLLNPHGPDPLKAMIDFVYDGISGCYKDPDFFRDRAIVTPLNLDVSVMNEKVLERLPEPVSEFCAVDELDEADNATIWTPELMASLELPGLPQFKLRTKPFSIVMLLRNMSLRDGLVNGTRMQVSKDQKSKFVITCRIVTGSGAGNDVFIPRILLEPSTSGLPFKFKRRQFPLRLCFVMTINKSQGQGFLRLGAYLPSSVFSHGQLYVALSRLIIALGLRILLIPGSGQGRMSRTSSAINWTRNVVLTNIFKALRGQGVPSVRGNTNYEKYRLRTVHFNDIVSGDKTVEVRLSNAVSEKVGERIFLSCGTRVLEAVILEKKTYKVHWEINVEPVLRKLLTDQGWVNTLPHASTIDEAMSVYIGPTGFWKPKRVVRAGGYVALRIEFIRVVVDVPPSIRCAAPCPGSLPDDLVAVRDSARNDKTASWVFMPFLSSVFNAIQSKHGHERIKLSKFYWPSGSTFESVVNDMRASYKRAKVFQIILESHPWPDYISFEIQKVLLGDDVPPDIPNHWIHGILHSLQLDCNKVHLANIIRLTEVLNFADYRMRDQSFQVTLPVTSASVSDTVSAPSVYQSLASSSVSQTTEAIPNDNNMCDSEAYDLDAPYDEDEMAMDSISSVVALQGTSSSVSFGSSSSVSSAGTRQGFSSVPLSSRSSSGALAVNLHGVSSVSSSSSSSSRSSAVTLQIASSVPLTSSSNISTSSRSRSSSSSSSSSKGIGSSTGKRRTGGSRSLKRKSVEEVSLLSDDEAKMDVTLISDTEVEPPPSLPVFAFDRNIYSYCETTIMRTNIEARTRIRVITALELTVYSNVCKAQQVKQKVCTRFVSEMTTTEMHSLSPNVWLNDNVMNQYLLLIEARSTLPGAPRRVVIQTTSFWKRYTVDLPTHYDNVHRFGKKNGNIQGKVYGRNSRGIVVEKVDLLLIPVHLRNVRNVDGCHLIVL